MKDAFGHDIHEGDRIVYADTESLSAAKLRKGTITRLSGSRIYYILDSRTSESWTVSSRVMRIGFE